MTLKINFDTQNKNWRLFEKRIKRWLQQSIDFCGFLPDFCNKSEINVHLVKNHQIKYLNLCYRSKNKVTNVLSVPYVKFVEGKFVDDEMQIQYLFLGEIFLAVDYSIFEAQQEGLIWQKHLQHLVIHSFLHIFGFDHINDDDYEKMNEWEDKLINNIK